MTDKVDVTALLNKNKGEEDTKVADPVVVQEEKEYQCYKSSRPSLCMITHTGRKIAFARNEFVTDDEEFIEYLDAEIAAGLKTVVKGEPTTSASNDPMVALRAKFYEEFKAEQEAATNLSNDMGNTKPAHEQKKVLTANETAS